MSNLVNMLFEVVDSIREQQMKKKPWKVVKSEEYTVSGKKGDYYWVGFTVFQSNDGRVNVQFYDEDPESVWEYTSPISSFEAAVKMVKKAVQHVKSGGRLSGKHWGYAL